MTKKFEEALDVIEKELLNLNDEDFQKILDKYKNGKYAEVYKKYSELCDNPVEIVDNLNSKLLDSIIDVELYFSKFTDKINSMYVNIPKDNNPTNVRDSANEYNLMYKLFFDKLDIMNKNVQQMVIKRLEELLKIKLIDSFIHK